MAGFSAYVDTDLPRRLRGFAAQMLDLRPFWPRAASLGGQWLREHFSSQGAWGGSPWADGPSYHGLVETGQLRGAAGNPARAMSATTLTLTVVDRVVHWHQYGTSKMPARPVVPPRIPGDAIAQLRAEFEGYVGEVINRWGLG